MMTSEVVNALRIHLRTALDGARDLSIRPPCARRAPAAGFLLIWYHFLMDLSLTTSTYSPLNVLVDLKIGMSSNISICGIV